MRNQNHNSMMPSQRSGADIEDFLFYPTGKVKETSSSKPLLMEEEPFFEFACIKTETVIECSKVKS